MFFKRKESVQSEDKQYMVSQWRLMAKKFSRHKVAKAGLGVLIILYVLAVFCEFFSTQDYTRRSTDYIFVPPQRIHIFHDGRLSAPFVYGLKLSVDPETWRKTYVEDKEVRNNVKLFVKGDPYKMWGFIDGDRHFIGIDDPEAPFYLLGSDGGGRDLMSRIIYALRISLTVGLVGVFFTFILGCVFGGISGFYGGKIDLFVQRLIEFLVSIPSIPLWLALTAALPNDWGNVQVYFAITIILSLVGWCGLARVVRGKLLELRNEDYVMAARLAGAGDAYIIRKHLLPGFMSHLIVSITISVPGMILGESSLSFLGVGLRPPTVSLGVLLKDAQNIGAIAMTPWILLPGMFIVIIVLAFNFLGDGLRDAADPYSKR